MIVKVFIKQEIYSSTTLDVGSVDEAKDIVMYGDWVNDDRVVSSDESYGVYEKIEEITDDDGEILYEDINGYTIMKRI